MSDSAEEGILANAPVVFVPATDVELTWTQAHLLAEAMAYYARASASPIGRPITAEMLHRLLGQLREQDPAACAAPVIRAWDGELKQMAVALRRLQSFEADSVKGCEELLDLLYAAADRATANQRRAASAAT